MCKETNGPIVIVSVRVGTAYFQAAVEAGGLTGALLRDMTEQCSGAVLPIDENVLYDLVKQLYQTAKDTGQTASVVA